MYLLGLKNTHAPSYAGSGSYPGAYFYTNPPSLYNVDIIMLIQYIFILKDIWGAVLKKNYINIFIDYGVLIYKSYLYIYIWCLNILALEKFNSAIMDAGNILTSQQTWGLHPLNVLFRMCQPQSFKILRILHCALTSQTSYLMKQNDK